MYYVQGRVKKGRVREVSWRETYGRNGCAVWESEEAAEVAAREFLQV